MPSETQEIQYDNLRVHVPAADKLREVVRVYKDKRGVSPTQSEALAIIADHYLVHVLGSADAAKAQATESP